MISQGRSWKNIVNFHESFCERDIPLRSDKEAPNEGPSCTYMYLYLLFCSRGISSWKTKGKPEGGDPFTMNAVSLLCLLCPHVSRAWTRSLSLHKLHPGQYFLSNIGLWLLGVISCHIGLVVEALWWIIDAPHSWLRAAATPVPLLD